MPNAALPDAGRGAGSPVPALVAVGFSFDDEREHGNQRTGIRRWGFGPRGRGLNPKSSIPLPALRLPTCGGRNGIGHEKIPRSGLLAAATARLPARETNKKTTE